MTRPRRSTLAVALALSALAACAGDQPIVDRKGVDPAKYEQDLAECREYADQVSVARPAVTNAAIGAAAGAAVGAALGAVMGNAGQGAALGAAGGGSSGVFSGAGKAYSKQERVLRNCLRGRGYSVLD